jgi:hypothetical protein
MKKRKAYVLDIDMELPSVVLSNIQWKKLWISSIWHEEEEGMCAGYRYATALSDVKECTVEKVMGVIYMS